MASASVREPCRDAGSDLNRGGPGRARAGRAARRAARCGRSRSPFRRAGRRLLRAGGCGSLTARSTTTSCSSPRGSCPASSSHRPSGPCEPRVAGRVDDGVELALMLQGGRAARLRVLLPHDDRAGAGAGRRRRAAAAGDRLGSPLRGAARRPRRPPRHPVRPGRPRESSSAPTAATPVPTARPRCSPTAASRRATARPCRGCCRAAATASGSRPTPTAPGSTSPASGSRSRPERRPARCELQLLCAATPAARLRAFCRLTGFPALLPEWGYGFWKSRDVHEHQDDVLDDFDGFRAPRHPARRDRDRLAVGDPIQHLGVQPPPVPRRPRDDRDDALATGCGPWCG